LKLATANGITVGQRGKAKTVALRKLSAENVAIVVQTDDRATYGDKIDGLLGMSFLSRFDMTIDAKSVRLKPRNVARTRAAANRSAPSLFP
jgi:aspartyl protease family protein